MFADDKPRAALFERAEQASSPDPTPLYPEWADAPMDMPRAAVPELPAMQDLRDLTQPEADPGVDPRGETAGIDMPLPYFHTTGSQLRHRLVTPESIAELQATEKPSLLQRLFGRK